MSYWNLLSLTLPVFCLIAVGVGVRRAGWVEGAAEASLIRLVVNLLMPCLIFESIVGNAAMRTVGNVLVPPLLGFAFTALGFCVSYLVARRLRLGEARTERTFALTTGIANYAYLPLPIMAAMFGAQSQGILLVHNVGVEAALWTIGVLVLSGLSLRQGWKKLLNPVVVTMFVAVPLNLLGLSTYVPTLAMDVVHALARCMVPLGLLMTGVNLARYIQEPKDLFSPRVLIAAAVLRLGILPLVMMCGARWIPCPVELKRVLVVQAAMPSAVIPIIVAHHYGGAPLTAVQIVLGTTAVSVLTCPLWIRAGLAWAGVGG
jgi:predicted permease